MVRLCFMLHRFVLNFYLDLGVSRVVNLVPNGDQISVTKENRLQYIYLVSHYRLSRQIKLQSEACEY